jgi:hypothetical protein
MNFLLFCAFGCGLHLLVIQLTITACLVPFYDSVQKPSTIYLIIMPVTMRSWAKLLTGSTKELSVVIPTGSHELIPAFFMVGF